MQRIAGKYEVVRPLGAGGMGKVLLVRHVDLDLLYALKYLDPTIAGNPKYIEQFKREAAALQQFTHPGMTQLRDFGRSEAGEYYLAMDYCEGRPLKDILDSDGPYPVKSALKIMIQLLDVLEAAHKQGIVHRDIKPANIMVVGDDSSDTPEVKILDFGTALLRQGGDGPNGDTTVLGTPCYMSPEQASGAPHLDSRVDIYACGIMLYELLTGSVPFEGGDVVQTLLMHITQPAPEISTLYGIPSFVEEIVSKALEKKRENRFQSAVEFAAACEDAVERHARGEHLMAIKPSSGEVQEIGSIADSSSTEVQPQKTKILCLDDDEMILNILKHLLEINGYEVFTALDVSAIHDILFEQGVDLLLSDVQMPGLPGTKVCRLIKKSMEDLKVVLFSNIPERDLEKYSEENGADGWISKNTRPEEWLTRIQEILSV
jgi:serine/threonine-protein kinase